MTKDEIKVGTPGCYQIGSDRYPIIVTEVISPRKIVVMQIHFEADKANGHEYFGSQNWKFYPEERHSPVTLTLRKNGRFVRQGLAMRYGSGYGFGQFSAYQDPSF
jgi:hypothetical protein